jgi:hypothetical protein
VFSYAVKHEIDKMAKLVAREDKKADIVQLSIESGVLCKYTSLLAYAKIMQG